MTIRWTSLGLSCLVSVLLYGAMAWTLAKLGITLIHARAYHPEAKGKEEREFGGEDNVLFGNGGATDERSVRARRFWREPASSSEPHFG